MSRYCEALTNTGDDFDLDFDPEYLKTQYIIADEGNEKDHIARVMSEQLIRETKLFNEASLSRDKYKRKLVDVAQLACQELIGQIPFPLDQY